MSRCRKRSARPARDGWHRRASLPCWRPLHPDGIHRLRRHGQGRAQHDAQEQGTVQRAMDGSDCRNASLLFAWNAELRMHAASVLGRLNERLRLRRPRRAGRHGRVTLCGRVRASVPRVSAECRNGGTGLRQQMLDDQAEPLGPALEQGIGAAIAENHRGQRRPARASSISPIAARSYCPASAAINHSGSRSRRNNAASRRSCTSRPVMQTPGRPWLTVSTMPLVLPGRDRGTDRSRAGARDSPRRACFRVRGLAARRRSPCAAGPRAPPGSRQRRNEIARREARSPMRRHIARKRAFNFSEVAQTATRSGRSGLDAGSPRRATRAGPGSRAAAHAPRSPWAA